MLLFKPEHVKPILDGTKTQTRRMWKVARVKVGHIYKAKTKMLSKEYFALLEILNIHREAFQSITEEEAQKEGGYTRESYIEKFFEINPDIDKITCHGQVPFNVWVVEFRVVYEYPID